jgi:hypothetical protein
MKLLLTWADRNKNQTYQFAITREDEEMLESKYDAKRSFQTIWQN